MDNSRESTLVERCRDGDRRALEELIGHYEKPIYNAAYRIVGNPDDAADVAQVVFLKAFEHLDRFNPKYRFFSWIYRIAINESINHVKRGGSQQELDENAVAPGKGPEDEADARTMSRQIQAGLMELNEQYRAVVVLRHFSDFSYREISEILQIPEKTVKSRLYTARQQMKESLQSSGLV